MSRSFRCISLRRKASSWCLRSRPREKMWRLLRKRSRKLALSMGLGTFASSLGAAQYCIDESVKYARQRKPFGKALAENQAIQWPLVELQTQCEMLRLLIRKTAWQMDGMEHKEIERTISDKVSMCNYWANRLVCEAADRAMQVHGGMGYSRHKPFEHIYRHHRRYRITEGSEEIQMRKVAAYLFGYLGPKRAQFKAMEEAAGGEYVQPVPAHHNA